MQYHQFQDSNPPTTSALDGIAGGGISVLDSLITILHKYIVQSDYYALLRINDRKKAKYWELMESKYDRLIIGMCERIIWKMNK